MAEIGKDIAKAKALLSAGELVAIPTETVYGLAANALDPQAISKIFEAKNRPSFDPLIMHCANWEAAKQHIRAEIPEEAEKLAQVFWPGPLTLLLHKASHVPDLLTSGLPRVALRVPNHPLSLDLLHQLDFPLAAPSANPFGYISPTSAQHVQDQLGDKLAYILDGGSCQVGVESSIVGFDLIGPTLYRPGGISLEDLEAVIGRLTVKGHSSSNPQAPGMLDAHYAPRTKVLLGDLNHLMKMNTQEDFAVLAFRKAPEGIPAPRVFVLSEQGDLTEAASRLFEGLRYLDNSEASLILAEPVPSVGLGLAINDRLKRASA